ncbi:MAG: DUF4825 domain-containing protein [Syntrophomonadaceae bacterium]|jgi:beta-lactamase regulating signal transducer with metallopeptidase domain|nr:DUF4825 domain-containing protein [Syntrophomonadaceae bacterium]
MNDIFLSILNMSIAASVVIIAVCGARLFLRRAPKVFSYALWAIALFNLLCPFKLESVFSLNPFKPAPIPLDIGMQAAPRIDSGVSIINNAVSAVLPAATPAASVNPLQVWTVAGAYVWLVGMSFMLIYAVVTYALLKRKLRFATKKKDDVYETDRIRSPFVMGFIRPKIYLPVGLPEADLAYILCHERTHIKRRDYLVKPVAYLALAVHWFNPLVWLAYFLLNADMEMSCDERVLKELGGEVKTAYSNALLALSTGKRLVGLSPLAFGEDGVKNRVKNVLNFQKRPRIIIISAVALVAVLTVGFAANRMQSGVTTAYDLQYFTVNGFGLGQDSRIIIDTAVLTPTAPLNVRNGYDYNFQEARYSVNPDTGIITKMHVNVVFGALVTSITKDNGMSVAYPSYTWHTIEDVTAFFGEGSRGWQDREQRLRYVEYIHKEGRLSATVRFVYHDGDDSLVWVIAESSPPYPNPNEVISFNKVSSFSELSALRTPYVGNNSAVGKIVGALPPLDAELTQRFFSIGDDYGTGYTPYTLTVYYEHIGSERNITITQNNAALLFALIDNLREVNFALRDTPSGAELDKAAYTERYTYSKENIAEFIGNIGLTWEDFQNDFEATATAVFTQNPPATTTLDEARELAASLPLVDLPLDYSKETAAADGVYVNIHGAEIYNQTAVDVFYENVFDGVSAFMRTMEYTVEGDPIITDYQFDGTIFTVATDTRRDKFGAQEIDITTYKYLVPLDRSLPAETTLQPYYLSNEQNIFTGTSDGEGATLVDGLRIIPFFARFR